MAAARGEAKLDRIFNPTPYVERPQLSPQMIIVMIQQRLRELDDAIITDLQTQNNTVEAKKALAAAQAAVTRVKSTGAAADPGEFIPEDKWDSKSEVAQRSGTSSWEDYEDWHAQKQRDIEQGRGSGKVIEELKQAAARLRELGQFEAAGQIEEELKGLDSKSDIKGERLGDIAKKLDLVTQQLDSDVQIKMMQVQEKLAARQQTISLGTNIVTALDQQSMAIVNNIGK
jgi:hypothetical protein